MKTIKKGNTGSEVRALQRALNLIVDGVFGSKTEDAVREFQKENGLTADGIVGPKTWDKLHVGPVRATREIREIIVHCSATPEGEDYTVKDIDRWHRESGYSNIGYHYVVYRDGSVHTGRDEEKAGAHCLGHNAYSIGVCYIGGCPERSTPKWNTKSKDTRTPAQKKALLSLLKELKGKYPRARIYGHRDFSSKPFPSFDAHTEYAGI